MQSTPVLVSDFIRCGPVVSLPSKEEIYEHYYKIELKKAEEEQRKYDKIYNMVCFGRMIKPTPRMILGLRLGDKLKDHRKRIMETIKEYHPDTNKDFYCSDYIETKHDKSPVYLFALYVSAYDLIKQEDQPCNK
jgi:hypothetical protein